MINEAAVLAGAGNTERSACRILRRLAAAVPANELIVELGAYKGRTTAWLALGAQEGHGAAVLAVDPWDSRPASSWPDDYADHLAFDTYGRSETREAFEAHMRRCGATRWAAHRLTAVDAARLHQSPMVGLLFHDAEHTEEAVRADLDAWLPHLSATAVVALHDAGNPRFGVERGAAAVLDTPDWDWAGRTLSRWRKRPDRRGLLVVRR
ncbi:MAG: class I SAM-dependent methyltransferase [Acidimicrobiia bacterium]|nr:class I SAM-dependent methyltransferase [Acidimicrobiia bacterium]